MRNFGVIHLRVIIAWIFIGLVLSSCIRGKFELRRKDSATQETGEPVAQQLLAVTSNKANGVYGSGDEIDIRLRFARAVTVTGIPSVRLETGTSDAIATYASGSGTDEIVFLYAPQQGHATKDLDVHASAQVDLNGGSIVDSEDQSSIATGLPQGSDPKSLASNKDLAIDEAAPVVGELMISTEDITTLTMRARWSAADDTGTAKENLEYKVFFSTANNITNFADAEANGTVLVNWVKNVYSATKSGLTANTTYYFAVFVRDQKGYVSAYTPKSATTEQFCGGNGTVGTPYQICTLGDLHSVRDYLSAYFVVNNNIDASETSTWNDGAGWEPIGLSPRFTGNFNGQHYRISSLFINRPTTTYVGLFGYVEGLTLSSIGLLNVNISGGDYVGGVVGRDHWNAQISYVYSTGKVSGTGDHVGGVLGGGSTSDIADSFSFADVTGATSVGGFAGLLNSGGTITRGFATGTVTASGANVGGMLGICDCTVTRSYAMGNVESTSSAQGAGGFIGRTGTTTISYSFAKGNIKVNRGNGVGGFVGWMGGGTISYSFAEGHVSVTSLPAAGIGGFAGRLIPGTINYSMSTGKVITPGVGGSAVGDTAHVSSVLTGVYGHDRSGLNCIGADVAGQTCTHFATGTVKPDDPISLHPIFNFVRTRYSLGNTTRKISLADEKAYKIWGGCNSEGAAVNITVDDQSASNQDFTRSTTCSNLSWSIALDFSAGSDGTYVVTVDQTGAGAKTITLSKDTAFCKANTTDNASGFAGDIATYNGSSAANAYRICNGAQFDRIRNNVSTAAFYRLENAIDLGTAMRTPLSDNSAGTCTPRFCAALEGNGFFVRNAFIIAPSSDYVSLVGFGGDSTASQHIRNFGVEDSIFIGANNINAIIQVNDVSGGKAVISGLYTNAHVNAITSNAYGLIRTDDTPVSDSMAHTQAISGGPGAQAFGSGNANYSRIYATGNMIASNGTSGLGPNRCTECFATGTGIAESVGGFIIRSGGFSGAAFSGSAISNSYATGHVIFSGAAGTSNYGGGFSGEVNNGSVLDKIYATGMVLSTGHASDTLGGLYGYYNVTPGATVSNSFAAGSMHSRGVSEGGLIGRRINQAGAIVSNSYFWDNALAPTVCIGLDSTGANPTCDEPGATLPARFTGNVGDVPAGGTREPLSSWDFTTPIWKFNTNGSLPILNWYVE